MKRAKKHLHLISNFAQLNKAQKKSVQKNLDKDQIKFLCEIAINLLCGNLPVNCEVKSKLKRFKKKLRKLASGCAFEAKKKVLQVGGFLPGLLSILASAAIGPLLEKLISKFSNG